MKLNKKIMALTVAGSLTLGGIAVGAAQKTDTVTRTFNNIQVEVDGEKEVPTNEPFMINGSVYVGLRDAANLVGASVNWDQATQTVEITSGGPTGDLEQALAKANFDLQTAYAQIGRMQEKIDQYESSGVVPDADDDDEETTQPEEVKLNISALENFLEDEFQDEFKIEWTFDLSGDEEELELELEYEGDVDHDKYNDEKVSEIEAFVEEICEEIQKEVEDEYGIEHIEVKGEIYDTDARETRAEFEIDDRGRFDFEDKNIPEIDEEEVKDYVAIIDSNYMDFPKVNLGAYDYNSISIRSITAKVDGDEIIVEVWTNMDDFLGGAWNRMNSNDADELEEYMEDLCDEIEGEFDKDVRGFVYNAYEEDMASYNGTLKLHDVRD